MMRSVLVNYGEKLMAENIIYLGKSMSDYPPPPFPEILYFKIAPLENEWGIFQVSSGEDSLNLNWRQRGRVMRPQLSPRQVNCSHNESGSSPGGHVNPHRTGAPTLKDTQIRYWLMKPTRNEWTTDSLEKYISNRLYALDTLCLWDPTDLGENRRSKRTKQGASDLILILMSQSWWWFFVRITLQVYFIGQKNLQEIHVWMCVHFEDKTHLSRSNRWVQDNYSGLFLL